MCAGILSMATTLMSGDESNLPLDSELTDSVQSDIEKWINESKLSVGNVTYAKTKEFEKQEIISASNTTLTNAELENSGSSEYSNITVGSLYESNLTESVKSDSVVENLDKLILSASSSEKSYSLGVEEKFSPERFLKVINNF